MTHISSRAAWELARRATDTHSLLDLILLPLGQCTKILPLVLLRRTQVNYIFPGPTRWKWQSEDKNWSLLPPRSLFFFFFAHIAPGILNKPGPSPHLTSCYSRHLTGPYFPSCLTQIFLQSYLHLHSPSTLSSTHSSRFGPACTIGLFILSSCSLWYRSFSCRPCVLVRFYRLSCRNHLIFLEVLPTSGISEA